MFPLTTHRCPQMRFYTFEDLIVGRDQPASTATLHCGYAISTHVPPTTMTFPFGCFLHYFQCCNVTQEADVFTWHYHFMGNVTMIGDEAVA